MIVYAKSRATGKVVSKQFVCHCCGTKSRKYKTKGGFPPRWVDRWEPCYGPTGVRRASQVQNHYCGWCIANGASARVVAAVTKKVLAAFRAGRLK